MLSNAYFLAKFRFDTAENEPAKNLQNFGEKLLIFPVLPTLRGTVEDGLHGGGVLRVRELRERLEDRRVVRAELLPHVAGQGREQPQGLSVFYITCFTYSCLTCKFHILLHVLHVR